jgi:hypothetical protein
MRSTQIAAYTLCVGVGLAAPAFTQVGHPAKGSWIGYWGPTEKDQRRLVLEMDYANGKVTGVLNPGPKAAKATASQIDYDTWTLTLEADLPGANGKTAHWVGTGKLENIGSWNNRRYVGTYKYGAETGKFHVVLH